MGILETILWAAVTALAYMTALFLIAMVRKDNSVADIAWGPGFIVVTWVALIINGTYGARQLTVAALVTIWGLRLAVRIARRNAGKGEDPRYRKWAAAKAAPVSFKGGMKRALSPRFSTTETRKISVFQ